MAKIINFDKTCSHQNIIDDVTNGDSVCTDCGLVVDQIYLFSTPTRNKYFSEETKNIYTSSSEKDFFDLIETICDKCNICNTHIKDIIHKKCMTLKKKCNQKICNESFITFCVYISLIEEKNPRPMSHLCRQTNTCESSVWQHIKLYESFYLPSHMCEYFLSPLNLDYKCMEKIRDKVKHIEAKCVFSPKTLIGSCAYLYLRENKISLKRKKQITMLYLSKILNISYMSINRCIKQIENL